MDNCTTDSSYKRQLGNTATLKSKCYKTGVLGLAVRKRLGKQGRKENVTEVTFAVFIAKKIIERRSEMIVGQAAGIVRNGFIKTVWAGLKKPWVILSAVLVKKEFHYADSEAEQFLPHCAPCSTRLCLDQWGKTIFKHL